MTDVIERAAQALCALKFDGDIVWDMQDDLAKEVYRKGARMVIEAMREPTLAVLDCRPPFMTVEDAKAMWQTMIDAALQR